MGKFVSRGTPDSPYIHPPVTPVTRSVRTLTASPVGPTILRMNAIRHQLAALVLGALPLLPALMGCQAGDPPSPISVPHAPRFQVEEEDWRFGRYEGRLLITPHYKIHTTLTDDVLVEVLPNFLETAHRLYAELVPVTNPSETKSNLYIFHSRNPWERFTRAFVGARADTYLRIRSGGYAEPEGTVLYQLRRRHYTMAVVAHECLHMYIHRNCPQGSVPPWLHEGLACYCEGHDWQGRTPRFTPGQNHFRMNAVRKMLAHDSLIRLDEILATHAGNILRYTPERTSAYYAQSWSLVAFLIHGGTYSEAFARLRGDLANGRARDAIDEYIRTHSVVSAKGISRGEALFRAYITEDLEEFSADYGVWLRKLVQPEPRPWRLLGHRDPAPSPAPLAMLPAGAEG